MTINEISKLIHTGYTGIHNAFIDDEASKYNGFSVIGVTIMINLGRVLVVTGDNSKWIDGKLLNFKITENTI
jgi:hypothetical protein